MKRPGLLTLLFFLSGASGLIYQVVWFRRLALVFGVTSYALGTVLAAFMAGLAIGSASGGWLADRRQHPLRLYGLAEIGIAACGLGVLPLFDIVQRLYVSLAPIVDDRPATLNALRFALSFAAMIPATACMGATLPLGVRAADARQGDAVSRLYAANTAGAVLGVLTGGFLLLGIFGLSTTSRIAVGANILCGVWALRLARSASSDEDERRGLVATGPTPQHVDTGLTPVHVGVMVTLAASGFAGLAYEIVWTRLFSVLAFEVVYGYAIMLAVLLAGIAVGSAWYGRVAGNRGNALAHLIGLQLGIGCIAALSSLALLPLASGRIMAGAISWPGIGDLVRRCPGCVSMLPGLLIVVFVTSALSGATIPAATRVLAGSGGPGWTTRLGLSYAGNLIGGVIGSAMAGFWLLPTLGAHSAILLIATLNVLVAAALALIAARPSLGLATLVAGALAIAPATVGATRFNVYRTALTARLAEANILWSDEGVESSVAVAQTPGDRFLLINGAIHSASTGLYYHRWLGHLGALAHPDPKDALVVGLGGGATAGAMALHPGLRVHVVELSNGVVSAAEHVLADDNYGLLSRPLVTREVDDGRNHLLVGGRTYDIIEADIVEPRHAGASVLYSREYFESAKKALRPGGIMVQWLGAPNSDAYTWTLSTFRSVFPHVTLWVRGDVGIGSTDPQTPLDRARLEELLREPVMRAALEEAQLGSVEQILALRAGDAAPWIGGPVLTDDRPVLEYFLTLPLGLARE